MMSDTEPNHGFLTYLSLGPNVETEEEKLQALDELIQKVGKLKF